MRDHIYTYTHSITANHNANKQKNKTNKQNQLKSCRGVKNVRITVKSRV